MKYLVDVDKSLRVLNEFFKIRMNTVLDSMVWLTLPPEPNDTLRDDDDIAVEDDSVGEQREDTLPEA